VIEEPDDFLTADNYTLSLSSDGDVTTGRPSTTVSEPWVGPFAGLANDLTAAG
jgi:hypothetical protein